MCMCALLPHLLRSPILGQHPIKDRTKSRLGPTPRQRRLSDTLNRYHFMAVNILITTIISGIAILSLNKITNELPHVSCVRAAFGGSGQASFALVVTPRVIADHHPRGMIGTRFAGLNRSQFVWCFFFNSKQKFLSATGEIFNFFKLWE